MIHTRFLFAVFVYSLSHYFVYAQDFQLPDCSNIEVVGVERLDGSPDETRVTLFNNCEACNKHVYTGMNIYSGDELVAMDNSFATEASPDNKSTRTYVLTNLRPFDLNNDFRMELFQICDSIKNNSIGANNGLLNNSLLVFPNPSNGRFKVISTLNSPIRRIELIGLSGKMTILTIDSTGYVSLPNIASGAYILRVATERGLFYRKIVKQ